MTGLSSQSICSEEATHKNRRARPRNYYMNMHTTRLQGVRPPLQIDVRRSRLVYPFMLLHDVRRTMPKSVSSFWANISATHQQVFRCRPRIRVLQQTAVHKRRGIGGELFLWSQPWRILVHDVLQQLENAHGHAAALEAHALALALVLLRRRLPVARWQGCGRCSSQGDPDGAWS